MVESSKLLFPGIPSRLGTAVLVQYLDYKHRVRPLLKRLSRGSAKYVVDNEQILDQFWAIAKRVKFSQNYLGISPDEFNDTAHVITESVFPFHET